MSPGARARPTRVLAIAGDAFILTIVLQWIDRDESSDGWNLILCAALILAVQAVLAGLLACALGLWAALPMLAAATAILRTRCDLSWTKALFAAHVLLAVQLAVWSTILRALSVLR